MSAFLRNSLMIDEMDLKSEINHFTSVCVVSKLNLSLKFKVLPFGTKFNSGNGAEKVNQILHSIPEHCRNFYLVYLNLQLRLSPQ